MRQRLYLASLATGLLASCGSDGTPAVDATPGVDAAAVDAAPPLGNLVINEVAAAGEPADWFEVVNATAAAIDLGEYVFVDIANDFVKAKPFPSMSLAPGAYYVQEVTDLDAGFKLGSDEELWVYRAADQRLADSVDWAEGASPLGGSYARVPDTTGAFTTVTPATRGAANN